MNFAELDKSLDMEEVKTKMEETSDFEPLPAGKYEVALDSLDLKESKNNDPMVTAVFKVVAGEFEDRLVFVNKVIQPESKWLGLQLKNVAELFKGLLDKEYEFNGFAQLEKDCKAILNEVQDSGFEYLMEISYKKGSDFANTKILEIFE